MKFKFRYLASALLLIPFLQHFAVAQSVSQNETARIDNPGLEICTPRDRNRVPRSFAFGE